MQQQNKDFIDVHLLLKTTHLELLKKINIDNQSGAARKVFDDYLKNKQKQQFEKNLNTTAIGLIVFALGLTFENIILQSIFYIVAGFLICYSFYQYMKGRYDYIKEHKKNGEMDS